MHELARDLARRLPERKALRIYAKQEESMRLACVIRFKLAAYPVLEI
jgi:hypothetical protein